MPCKVIAAANVFRMRSILKGAAHSLEMAKAPVNQRGATRKYFPTRTRSPGLSQLEAQSVLGRHRRYL